MSSPVAKALWGHYRRHPFQILLVWLGLTLGIALLVGVMAVNQQARESYRQGEQLFSNPFPHRIRHVQMGLKVPQGFYVQLRRSGFNTCVPFEQHRIVTDQGRDFEIVGVDPVAMFSSLRGKDLGQYRGQMLELMKPPYPVMIGSQLASYMGVEEGQKLTLNNGRQIGPLRVVGDERIGGPRMIADMALLRELHPSAGITTVLCGEMSQKNLTKLAHILPPGLTLERHQGAKLEPLTEAFHLNLFAMGMLSFVIGLFIFYQAMSLSLSQRQPLVGLLRQAGVSGFQLASALFIELIVWIILGLIGGNLLGLLLAQQLLPSVAATLSDLYSANVSLSVTWHWQWGAASVAIAVFGSLLACGWPMIRLIKTPPARLATHMALVRFSGREFAWQALFSCIFIGAAIAVYQLPHGQLAGFVLIACILIASGLMMPFLLWQLFQRLGLFFRSARLRWFFSDAAASLSYRGVAAMAFMLALASNIGMETMVGSFRSTTESWLGQRLAADIYVRPSHNVAPRISKWLEQQPEVEQVWWQWSTETPTEAGTLEVKSVGGSAGERDALLVKVAEPDYWYKLHNTQAVMVSESMALKQGWRPGDKIELPAPMIGGWIIAGVYYDYGNPYGQVLISNRHWQALWPKTGQVGLAIHLEDDADSTQLMAKMGERFRLQPERVRNNAELMNQAMRVFDRTFIVTATLGKLTLFIAVCGLFFATVAGEVSRQRQFALLRCMGMTGRELAALGGGQLLVIGLMTALMALPLGLVLAQLLIDVVLKYSFGWTMPIHFFPTEYLLSLGSALLVLLAAGAWPVWRLVKRSAILSLREAF
ncbi:ABC transporter permease [Photobacterium lipolyticum]|uniref:ABC transporter permease n=1 Tax=Photobacterium lipolyticum TaxID=266810 RepID=A0A2T3MV22_9GAMM|nr:ABC transporter permease [Photobacterium lipolyticum]PSW03777.1 ABC transporter permease [Photobacterium lipolyticum]